MSILVTGGAGFIGSNFILDWIKNQGEKVINLDKLTYAGNPTNLAHLAPKDHILVKGDIGDQNLVENILKAHQPKAIINFAAESHVDRSIHGPADFIETNIVGTFHLLEEVKNYYTKLPDSAKKTFRFLHVSTDEVYGSLKISEPPFTEEHPYAPNSPYSASKASSDHLVRAYHSTYDLPTLTTNCSNNYGPYQFPEKLIPLMIINAISGKDLTVYGDGHQIRDWLYVSDHVKAICLVLEKGHIGQTYNIGGNQEKTNLEVIEVIIAILDNLKPRIDGRSYREQITHIKDRPGHDRRYAINARKIETELGFIPQYDFEEGIKKTVNWYLSQPDWVENVQSGAYKKWLKKQYGTNAADIQGNKS